MDYPYSLHFIKYQGVGFNMSEKASKKQLDVLAEPPGFRGYNLF